MHQPHAQGGAAAVQSASQRSSSSAHAPPAEVKTETDSATLRRESSTSHVHTPFEQKMMQLLSRLKEVIQVVSVYANPRLVTQEQVDKFTDVNKVRTTVRNFENVCDELHLEAERHKRRFEAVTGTGTAADASASASASAEAESRKKKQRRMAEDIGVCLQKIEPVADMGMDMSLPGIDSAAEGLLGGASLGTAGVTDTSGALL